MQNILLLEKSQKKEKTSGNISSRVAHILSSFSQAHHLNLSTLLLHLSFYSLQLSSHSWNWWLFYQMVLRFCFAVLFRFPWKCKDYHTVSIVLMHAFFSPYKYILNFIPPIMSLYKWWVIQKLFKSDMNVDQTFLVFS